MTFETDGYATVACVREELVQGLKTDAFVIAATGPALVSSITLPDRTTEAITAVTVNGSPTSAYTFNGLDKLTFSPALTLGDAVKVSRDTKVSDARILKDSVVVSQIINSMIGSRYTIPFDLARMPTLIQSAACALTAMRIRERLFGSTGQTPGDPHAIREWDIWMNLLRGVAAGEQSLVYADGTVVTPKTIGIMVSNKNEKPIFSLEDEPDISYMPRNRNYPYDSIDGGPW